MKTHVAIPATLFLICAGCVAPRAARRDAVLQEQLSRQNTEARIDRLEAQVEESAGARNQVFRQMEDLQAEVAALRKEMEALQQNLRSAIDVERADRIKDRAVMIEELSAKMAALMRSRPAVGGGGSQAGYEHVVRPGETLSEIARAYGVSLDAIVKANQIKDVNTVRVGQKLFIPE